MSGSLMFADFVDDVRRIRKYIEIYLGVKKPKE